MHKIYQEFSTTPAVFLNGKTPTNASVEHYGVQAKGCMDNDPEPYRGVPDKFRIDPTKSCAPVRRVS